ncbi:MAG: hypothetical protein ACYCVZ_01800 [Streptosporangiaceae bacterium]
MAVPAGRVREAGQASGPAEDAVSYQQGDGIGRGHRDPRPRCRMVVRFDDIAQPYPLGTPPDCVPDDLARVAIELCDPLDPDG